MDTINFFFSSLDIIKLMREMIADVVMCAQLLFCRGASERSEFFSMLARTNASRIQLSNYKARSQETTILRLAFFFFFSI
jgi:hypothetical protein